MSVTTTNQVAIQNRIIDFLQSQVLYDQTDEQIRPQDPLFEGLLDSMGTLRLAVFVEETYRLQVSDGELVPENFDTVECIARYILRKTGQ
jgi:acyl carrier protein